MQNTSIRVRGSLGLKNASEFSEKGSALIDTDSSATARVEVEETLNKTGDGWTAAKAAPPMAVMTITEYSTAMSGRAQQETLFLINGLALYVANARIYEMRLTNSSKKLAEGPPGGYALVPMTINSTRARVNEF